MAVRVWLLGLLAAAAACVNAGAYRCASSADCGADGTCAPADDGRTYCALPSSNCGSGLEFGPSAGIFSQACVAGSAGDASISDDGPVADAGGAASDAGTADASDGPAGPTVAAECVPGAAIAATSTQCAAVCARQPSCCTAGWTRLCVQRAEVECDLACGQRVAFASTGVVEVLDLAAAGPNAVTATALPSFGDLDQYYQSVAWNDLDRDGVAELLVSTDRGDHDDNDMWILRPGAAWQTVVDLRDFGDYRGSEIHGGDYDGDGRTDVILTGLYPGVKVVHNRGPGVSFEAGASPPSAVQEYFGAASDVGDYDNDGDLDLAVLDYWNGGGQILRWATDRFEAGPSFGPFTTPRRITFGDVDGDLDLDLAIADDDYVRVVRNDAGELTAQLWSYTVANARFTDAAWIDIDGDFDLDLAVVENHFHGGPLRLFENTGTDLSDQPRWTSTTLEQAWKLAVGDVDDDGDLDLAVANQGLTNKIYLNNGNWTFRIGWQAATARNTFGAAFTARPPAE